VPLETPRRIVTELAQRGYNAEREAVTLLARTDDPGAALDRTIESMPPDALKLSVEHVQSTLDDPAASRSTSVESSVSTGTNSTESDLLESVSGPSDEQTPVEAEGLGDVGTSEWQSDDGSVGQSDDGSMKRDDRVPQPASITGDITGESTGTGEYKDFVAVFCDRYEQLSGLLRGRVNHRPTNAVRQMPGGNDAALVGMVSDIRSTANGHWLIELEDTNGVFPCLITKDRSIADLVDELLLDEVIAVDGTLSDDAGILFVNSLHFPDVPHTHRPNTADRPVQAALISDVHVGSQEFMADAWSRFARWLHTDEAESVEYLLLAGDMVEGVGVYPNQDEELSIVDIYEQYEAFSEYLKEIPGDMEIVMIPGNHDAVRLAEPQPAFDEELREIMSAHDARITGNPSMVTIEGVSVLMYHGVSLDEVIAELPEGKASYDHPHRAMYQLLKKRHVAPQYGGHTRLAPEKRDYLVMEDVPDIFHTGHVHKLGYGKYHNVLAINSGCWQEQTSFQKSVNIDPDHAFAPIVDLDTLSLTLRDFN
jgi:DNA polymerase II small subunit